MSFPNQQEVRVATDALRVEAKVWDEQSAVMEAVSAKVNDMELGRLEAGIFQLVVGPYNDVVTQVAGRAKEAVQAMKNIGNALRTAADTYEAEDAAGEHRLRNLY